MDMPAALPEEPHGATEDLVVAVEQVLRHVRQSATAGGLGTAASALLGRLSREGPSRLTEPARAEGVRSPTRPSSSPVRSGRVRCAVPPTGVTGAACSWRSPRPVRRSSPSAVPSGRVHWGCSWPN